MARYRTFGPNRWFTLDGTEYYPGDDGWITPPNATVEAAMRAAGLMSDSFAQVDNAGNVLKPDGTPVSGGGLVSTTSYASAAALEAAYPAASNSGKQGIVGSTIYYSNGTAWTATGSNSASAPSAATLSPIFMADLRSSITPQIPESSQVTVTYTRNFNASALNSSGNWVDVAHQTPAFGWVPAANRTMLMTHTGASSTVTGTSNRDLTQAGWVKTNCAAAKTQTGIDGVANSASSLTATADGATAFFGATAGSTARTAQMWLKRLAGFGRVWISVDGGAAWVDVTGQINTNTFTRVYVTKTLANPSVGIRLEYSGDAVAVDCASCIASALPAPPLMGRADSVEASLLSYAPAKPAGQLKAFALEFTMAYDQDRQVGVQLTNGSSALFNLLVNGGGNGAPAVQLIGGGNIIYNTVPTVVLEAFTTVSGKTDRYLGLYVGGAVFVFANGRLCAIYDNGNTPTAHNADDYTDLKISGANGGVVSQATVHEWRGRLVTLLGDSISAVEAYRLNVMGYLGDTGLALNKGIGGNTVANIRDRIVTDCVYAFPTGITNTAVIWGGTNSLANNATPAATLAEMQTAINNVLAINPAVKIVLPTTFTQRTGGLTGITAAQFKTNAETYNTGLSSLVGGSAGIQVVEMNSATDYPVDTANAAFLSDGIHPKYKYYPVIARKITAACA